MLALASISYAQKLPSSIRGYKVYRTDIRVGTSGDKRATVEVGEPRIVDVGLSGMTLEATAVINGLGQDGQIDFLMFEDVAVNGIRMDVDEYQHSFDLKKGRATTLPAPVRGHVSTLNVAKTAYNEATTSRPEWQITGTVFVFGRFKKMGFAFKRVIPVPITLVIPNPLKSIAADHR